MELESKTDRSMINSETNQKRGLKPSKCSTQTWYGTKEVCQTQPEDETVMHSKKSQVHKHMTNHVYKLCEVVCERSQQDHPVINCEAQPHIKHQVQRDQIQ